MLALATMAGSTCYAGNECCFNIEHSWAGALWLSGLKQILLTHNVVRQYHSKPIWHAILSIFPLVCHSVLSNKGGEKGI